MPSMIDYMRLAEQKARKRKKNRVQYLKMKAAGRPQAATAVKKAIKEGRLPAVTTLTCRVPGCNWQAVNYHHWSYKEEHRLSVIPVCITCHKRIHAGHIVLKRPKSLAIKCNSTGSRNSQ